MKKQIQTTKSSVYSNYLKKLNRAGFGKDFSHYVCEIEKNHYFNKLLSSFPFAIGILDYQTQKYLYVNGTAGEELTGFPMTHFVEKGIQSWINRMHPDDYNEFANHSFSKFLAEISRNKVEKITNCKFSYTYRFKRKDNVWVKFLQNTVVLEVDGAKNPLLILSIVSDITLYKKDNAVIFSYSHYDKKSGFMNFITQTLNCCKNTSEREKEVVRYIAKGVKTKDIAIKMSLSEYTIRAHKRNIFEKTNTKNIGELIEYAFANGII